mmetsp:Transcript_4644/g.7106  ORF Transcript_4644/g.7106 Transcript_4644/m.7106 type:complete len:93 (-) Transcript_4644:656-934(-)
MCSKASRYLLATTHYMRITSISLSSNAKCVCSGQQMFVCVCVCLCVSKQPFTKKQFCLQKWDDFGYFHSSSSSQVHPSFLFLFSRYTEINVH